MVVNQDTSTANKASTFRAWHRRSNSLPQQHVAWAELEAAPHCPKPVHTGLLSPAPFLACFLLSSLSIRQLVIPS